MSITTFSNGSVSLVSANTWYQVPDTLLTSPSLMVVTPETMLGTIRFGFDNTNTPSSTNGNQISGNLVIRLRGSQAIYFSSSSAGDRVNYTAKVL